MTDLQKLAKELAADDRLWNTQEQVEKNLLAALEKAYGNGYAACHKEMLKDGLGKVEALLQQPRGEPWTVEDVVTEVHGKWDGLLYIVDGEGRKLGSANHIEAKSIVAAHNATQQPRGEPWTVDDIDILERYPDDLPDKAKGHRHWGRMSWLYPGDIVCQISGETAKAINAARGVKK